MIRLNFTINYFHMVKGHIGLRIAFNESNYGDVCEINIETREVRNLTKDLGTHHSFLRVLFLPNGDYILIGPKEFKDRYISRRVESELWIMDKDAKYPPKPLGRRGMQIESHIQ